THTSQSRLQHPLTVAADPYRAFAHPTGGRLHLNTELALRCDRHVAMTANDEVGITLRYPQQEVHGTEVPILDPDIVFLHQGEDLVKQSPFMGVSIFAEDDVGDQH